MDYVRLYVTLRDDPKMIGLPDKAFRAYIEALCWAGQHETDGRLPDGFLPQAIVERLVWIGLIEDDPHGSYIIHNWPKYQRTHADMESVRDAGRKANAVRWGRRTESKKESRRESKRESESESELDTERNPEVEVEVEVEKPTTNFSSAVTDDAHGLTVLLVAALRERGVKIPGDLRSWDQAAERLLRIDARPLAEAMQVLVFSQADSFWSVNILSMPKFRSKYDQLRLRMNAPTNGHHEETTAERFERLGLS